MDYAAKAVDANRMLKKYGAAGTLKRAVAGGYDSTSGTVVVAPGNEPVTCAVFDFPRRLINGTTILEGDKQVYMSVKAPLGAAVAIPVAGDTLTWMGVDYQVINATDLAPAGVSVLYTLQVRK